MEQAMLETNPEKRAHLNHGRIFILNGTVGGNLIAGDKRDDKQRVELTKYSLQDHRGPRVFSLCSLW